MEIEESGKIQRRRKILLTIIEVKREGKKILMNLFSPFITRPLYSQSKICFLNLDT